MVSDYVAYVYYPAMLLLLCTVASCSFNPEDRLKAFENVYNSHDVEKIISFYAEDIVHEVPGQFVLNGREEMRGLAEYDKVLNMQLSFNIRNVEGDTVTCEFIVTDDWVKTAGIEQVDYNSKFVFDKGLIIKWIAEPTPETARVLGAVFKTFVKWVSEEKPEHLKEMAPEGRFIYSAENARKSLALLKEWKAATEGSRHHK